MQTHQVIGTETYESDIFTGTVTTGIANTTTACADAATYKFTAEAGKQLFMSELQGDIDEYSKTGNYNFIFDSNSKIVINRAPVTIKCEGISKQYDGSEFEYEYSSTKNINTDGKSKDVVGLINGENIHGTLKTSSKAVGDYIYEGTVAPTPDKPIIEVVAPAGETNTKLSNYNISYDVTLSITKANLSIFPTAEYTYDGTVKALSFDSASDSSHITGLASGEGVTVTFTTKEANVGTYTTSDGAITIGELTAKDGTSLNNYNTPTYNVSIVIKPKEISKEIFDVQYTNEFIFNGAEQSPASSIKVYDKQISTTAELAKDTDYTVSCTPQIRANQGDVTYSFGVTGKGNYKNQTLTYT